MLANRLKEYDIARASPAAVLVGRVAKMADDLEEFAHVAADLVPGSPLSAWCGDESAERLVGHLKALAWMCRSASACILGETH